MVELPEFPLGDDRFAGSSVRMAALSLLLHQVMKRSKRVGASAAANNRLGHELTGLFDGLFGGHAPASAGEGIAGMASGTEGLMHALREHGLGDLADSWIGNGPNLPITPQQVAMAFDLDEVDSMAKRAGTDRDHMLREIATLLPQFIHDMTPHGTLPQHDADVHSRLSGVLGGLAGRPSST